MGVPVVTPSNTPERICTWSGSRRGLTWRLLPGRRRSRSRWMSASASAMPGGQPSTTQPSAGPWLSPNVVTVNSRPNVFPDMLRSGCRVAGGALEIAGRQKEDAAAAVLELEPDERQVGPCPLQRFLAVPHLDHQYTVRREIRARMMQDSPHRCQTVVAGGQADGRLAAVLRRHGRHGLGIHVGRVADDEVVAPPG